MSGQLRSLEPDGKLTSIAVVIVVNLGARLGGLEVLVLDLGKSNHLGGRCGL
jgi:hypothetical protein